MDKLTSKNKDDKVLNATLDRYWNSAQASRRELDWKWFNYDLWVLGNHYAKWDKNTQQIITSPRTDGKPKVVINKTFSIIRAVRNYVVRNEPKPDVTPDNLTQDNLEEAATLNKYLDYIYDRLGLRPKLRATVWHALKYSVGYWQVLYDDTAEDGTGEIQINIIDPYDLYWDPAARFPEEARYAILAVRRNVEDLKEDPKYKDIDWDAISPDNQLASSSLKTRLLQYERGQMTFNKEAKDSTVILREYWIKEFQKPKKDEEGRGKYRIRIISKIQDRVIRNELTDLDRLPFFRLLSDTEPLSMYGQGWVKNIIPLNRLYEQLHSSVAEYNLIMNKGKWVADKGAGVRIINNENGQIIEKKRGFEVSQAAITPLAAAIFQQIDILTRDIEDISSFHDASLGRIPTGAKSGVSIEALQEGDSNNLSELTENTEDFLSRVYEYVLYLASQKYQFARNVIIESKTGQKEFMKVIGADASTVDPTAQNGAPQGATVINKKNVVHVKMDSWLAYTSEGRRDAVKDLAGLLAAQNTPLPVQYILEAYETGNIADIIQQIQQDQAKQQQQQAQQQQQQAQMQAQQQSAVQQQAQQAQQPAPAGAAQAIAVIRQIINGRMPQQVPQVVSPDYIAYFDHFIQGAGSDLPPEIKNELQYIRDHAAATMQGGAQPSIYAQQQAPAGGASQ